MLRMRSTERPDASVGIGSNALFFKSYQVERNLPFGAKACVLRRRISVRHLFPFRVWAREISFFESCARIQIRRIAGLQYARLPIPPVADLMKERTIENGIANRGFRRPKSGSPLICFNIMPVRDNAFEFGPVLQTELSRPRNDLGQVNRLQNYRHTTQTPKNSIEHPSPPNGTQILLLSCWLAKNDEIKPAHVFLGQLAQDKNNVIFE